MTLLAVPNVSEGRDSDTISALQRAVLGAGAMLLDTHSDAVHHRSVLTVTANVATLTDGMVNLVAAARDLIDLTRHSGVHPRVGAVDVCPFVPFRATIAEAAEAASETGARIGDLGVPVFLYGLPGAPALPELRRGGLDGLIERVAAGLQPDHGPAAIERRSGVVCVGARGPLIAFNVNFAAGVDVGRRIAATIRAGSGGPEGLRALGLPMPDGSQVSMNITEPGRVGIDEVFEAVEKAAGPDARDIVSTEIVGLVEERFLPNPDAKAARLLIEPGRSVESALKR